MTSSVSHAAPVAIGASLDGDAVPLSVFLDRTKGVLRAGWPSALLIEATVIKITRNAGGHGLELVDSGPRGAQAGQLRAFLPATALPSIRRDLGFDLEPEQLVGLDAVLRIAPSFDPKWHLQSRILGLGRVMAASLAARRLEAAEGRLRQEGLFERQRRLPHPIDVTRLAVIHPPGSAGLADVAREIATWKAAGLLHPRFVPAPFEGLHAADQLAAALLDAVTPIADQRPDVVLLLRGGGARSGLLVLDDEALARAVATLPVPVITGLGHATDRSLVDAVAHSACDTPSKAIGFVRELIREPARRALADLAEIRRGALAKIAAATNEAAILHGRALAGAERTLAAAETACGNQLAVVRTQAREGRAGAVQLTNLVDRHRERIMAALPIVVGDAMLQIDGLLRDAGAAVRSGLATLPDLETALVMAQTRAANSLSAAEHEIARLIESVATAAKRLLDHHDALLLNAELGLGDLDHVQVLGRGFALVRDTAGHVLTSRAAAEAAGSILIEFGDGVLAAVAISDLTAGPGAKS